MINISEPEISSENIQAVIMALENNSVSTYGEEVRVFEDKLREHSELEAVAVNSGTSALEVSIDCHFNQLDRKEKYNIGFCDFTFIATPNAILNTSNNAIPFPCNPDDFLPDLTYLEKRLKNSLNLDLFVLTLPFGNFSKNVEKTLSFLKEFKIPIILDAAASICLDFSKIKHVIEHSCISVCLSFNGNKVITSGAGGAILTSDESFSNRARSLITLHRIGAYEHSAPGQNKKMPALNAALGMSQLKELNNKKEKRLFLYSLYKKYSENFERLGFDFFPTSQFELLSHWIYFLKPKSISVNVDSFREKLNKNGYNSPPFWKPITQQNYYVNFLELHSRYPTKSYPDLLQMPMTLSEPKKQIENLVKIMESET